MVGRVRVWLAKSYDIQKRVWLHKEERLATLKDYPGNICKVARRFTLTINMPLAVFKRLP